MYEKLRELRKQNHVTCKNLAELLGFKTRSAYQKKETGNVSFTLEEAKKISDYFQKNIYDIFFDSKVSLSDTTKNKEVI